MYDTVRFDPVHVANNFNVLTDALRPGQLFIGRTEPIHHNACRHELATNALQSNLPPQDYQAERGVEYEVQALCRKCRIHLDVGISYNSFGSKPCPNGDYPLHHFLYKTELGPVGFGFDCSSPDCGASLRVHYTQPVISETDLELLTNEEHAKRRYEHAVSRDAARHGFLLATPVQTLWKLRRYIRDSLKPDSAGKKIPTANKRFLESFGDDCGDLLTKIGFRYIVSEHKRKPAAGAHF